MLGEWAGPKTKPGGKGGFAPDQGTSGGFREENVKRDAEGQFADKPGSQDAGKGPGAGGVAAGAGQAAGAKPKASRSAPGYHEASDEERLQHGVPKDHTDVHVADDPQAMTTWRARNAAGQPVAKYHPAYTDAQARAKYVRNKEFADRLPAMQAQLETDARAGHEEAAVLRLILLSAFRNGGEEAESQVKGAEKGTREKTYGANTLEKRHVKIEGHTAHFDFPGKSGERQQHSIEDADLVADLQRRLDKQPTERLFGTKDAKVLKYLRSLPGADRGEDEPFRVHDLRTWNANRTALAHIETLPVPTNPADYWRQRDEVGAVVGKKIGDKPETALLHYIDPTLFHDWQAAAGITANSPRPKAKKKAKPDGPKPKGK